MTLEEIVAKQWEEATIQDNFIFSKTMELYPDICKKLIELILKIKVKSLHYPEREKTIETRRTLQRVGRILNNFYMSVR